MNLESFRKGNNPPTPTQQTETENGLPASNKEISPAEIAELEEPIKRIILGIRDGIERGEYGIIIGDDASGRIPARILGDFIKKISKHKKLPGQEIIFIPGRLKKSEDYTEGLKSHLAKYGFTGKGKVLIITEVIQSGLSLNVLTETLRRLGYSYDIATIGIDRLKDQDFSKRRQKNLGDSKIISGEYSRRSDIVVQTMPKIYRRKFTTGVYKHEGDLKSTPVKSGEFLGGILPEEKEVIQSRIKQSRREMSAMVDRLVSWYLSL